MGKEGRVVGYRVRMCLYLKFRYGAIMVFFALILIIKIAFILVTEFSGTVNLVHGEGLIGFILLGYLVLYIFLSNSYCYLNSFQEKPSYERRVTC